MTMVAYRRDGLFGAKEGWVRLEKRGGEQVLAFGAVDARLVLAQGAVVLGVGVLAVVVCVVALLTCGDLLQELGERGPVYDVLVQLVAWLFVSEFWYFARVVSTVPMVTQVRAQDGKSFEWFIWCVECVCILFGFQVEVATFAVVRAVVALVVASKVPIVRMVLAACVAGLWLVWWLVWLHRGLGCCLVVCAVGVTQGLRGVWKEQKAVMDQRRAQRRVFFRDQGVARAQAMNGDVDWMYAAGVLLQLDVSGLVERDVRAVLNRPRSADDDYDFRRWKMLGDTILQLAVLEYGCAGKSAGDMSKLLQTTVTGDVMGCVIRKRLLAGGVLKYDAQECSNRSLAERYEALVALLWLRTNDKFDLLSRLCYSLLVEVEK